MNLPNGTWNVRAYGYVGVSALVIRPGLMTPKIRIENHTFPRRINMVHNSQPRIHNLSYRV